MEEHKNGNKKAKGMQNKNIFNIKIPIFMNDSKKNIINQRNIEDDKFSQIQQVYEISQNNYYNNDNVKGDFFTDIIDECDDKIPCFKEYEDKHLSKKSTKDNDLFNSIFNNNDSFDSNKIEKSSSLSLYNSNIYNYLDSIINDDIFDDKNIHKYNIDDELKSIKLLTKKIKRNDFENSQESDSSDLEFCHSESFNNEDPFNIQFNLKKSDLSNKISINNELKNNLITEYDNNLQNLFGFDPNSSILLKNLQDKKEINKININNKINKDNINNKNLTINCSDNFIEIYNYNNYKNKYYHIYKDYKFEEPPFIDLKTIINDKNNESMIENLGNELGIFFGDLIIIEKGFIFENLSNFLRKIKNEDNSNIIYKYKIRKFMIDEMSNKIKTFLLKQIIEHINSFEEMENDQIKILDIDVINNKIKGDFNYVYLFQYIYSILSNESKYKNNNREIIEKKLKDFNEKGDYSKLVEYLHYTVKDYLDMIRYKKIDETKKMKEKLEHFLIFEFKNFKEFQKKGKGLDFYINLLYKKKVFNPIQNSKKEILDYIKKDYICSLLLLTYNLERFFVLRKKRGFKTKTKKKF